MATSETVHAPSLGVHGQPCASCGAPLAADQRYCLNCGARRAEPRLAYDQLLHDGGNGDGAPPDSATAAPAAAAQPPAREWGPLLAIGALAALGVMFVLGVLIGKDSGGGSTNP